MRSIQAARSMGASRWDIFRRIILPGVLPSIVVGHGSRHRHHLGSRRRRRNDLRRRQRRLEAAASSGGGLGFFIWNSYIGGSYPEIVVGMISIGIAGYLSSAPCARIGIRMTPWLSGRDHDDYANRTPAAMRRTGRDRRPQCQQVLWRRAICQAGRAGLFLHGRARASSR